MPPSHGQRSLTLPPINPVPVHRATWRRDLLTSIPSSLALLVTNVELSSWLLISSCDRRIIHSKNVILGVSCTTSFISGQFGELLCLHHLPRSQFMPMHRLFVRKLKTECRNVTGDSVCRGDLHVCLIVNAKDIAVKHNRGLSSLLGERHLTTH